MENLFLSLLVSINLTVIKRNLFWKSLVAEVMRMLGLEKIASFEPLFFFLEIYLFLLDSFDNSFDNLCSNILSKANVMLGVQLPTRYWLLFSPLKRLYSSHDTDMRQIDNKFCDWWMFFKFMEKWNCKVSLFLCQKF